MKPSVRNSIETKASRPTNFFLTSKSSIGNKFRKYCKHVSKFRKKPGGLSKFMPNPQKVLPWIGLRVVFLLFFIAETSDKMQLCKLHYFCYCLSLQVGVNMLAAIHFTVAFIVLLALSFTPRPSNTKEDNPLAYLLVYVYLTIAIIAYSIAVVASFLEYKVMYRTSYFLILISFIYWIALCGCAFFGDDRLKSLVCIDDRCGQSMWLISFKRATYIHGDCRAYVPHRVTRIRRRVRKGDEHQSDHNVTDFEWFTVNRNMTGIDDFSTRNHAGDLDWFGMSEELDYLPEKTTGAAADLFTTRFSNPISGLNSDILSSAMMSTAAQSSGALSSILIPNFRSSDESSEDPMIDPPSSSIDVESSELLPPGRIYSSGNDTRKPTFGKFNVLRESSTVGESVSSSNIASFKLPLPNGSFLKIGPFHDEFASIEPLYLYNVSDIPPQNIDPKTVTLFVSHLTSPEFEVSTVREEVEKERAANDGAENEDEIDFSKRKLSLVDTEKSEMLSPHIDEKANVDLKSTGLRHLSKMTNKRNIGVDTLFDTNIVVQRNSSETITDHKAAGDGKKDYRTMEEDRNSHKSGKRLIQNRESNSELLNGENERYSVRVKTLSAKLDDGEILKQIRDQYAGGESNSTTKKGPVVEQGARRRQGQNQGPGGAGRMQGGAGGRGRHNPRRKGGKPTTDANSSGDEEDDGGADDYESSYYDDGNGFPDKNLNGKANPAAVQPPGQGPSKSSQSAGQQKGVGVPIQSNFNPYDYFPPNLPEKKANAFPPGFLPPNLVRKPSAGGESSGVQEGAGTIGTRIKNATSSLWPFGPGGPGDATRNPPGQSPNATMEGGHCIFYSKATLFYVVSSLVLFFSNVGLVLYMLLVIRSHMDEVDKTGWSNGPYGFGTSTPVTGRSSAIYNVNGGAGSPSRSRATYSPVAQAPPSRPSSTPTPIPSEPVSAQPKSKSPSRAHAGYERDTNDDRGALDRRNPRSGGYRDTKDTDHRSPSRVTDTSNRYGSTPRDRETGSYRSPVRSADTNRRYGATVQDTDGYRSPTRRQLSPVRHDPTTNPVSRKVDCNISDNDLVYILPYQDDKIDLWQDLEVNIDKTFSSANLHSPLSGTEDRSKYQESVSSAVDLALRARAAAGRSRPLAEAAKPAFYAKENVKVKKLPQILRKVAKEANIMTRPNQPPGVYLDVREREDPRDAWILPLVKALPTGSTITTQEETCVNAPSTGSAIATQQEPLINAPQTGSATATRKKSLINALPTGSAIEMQEESLINAPQTKSANATRKKSLVNAPQTGNAISTQEENRIGVDVNDDLRGVLCEKLERYCKDSGSSFIIDVEILDKDEKDEEWNELCKRIRGNRAKSTQDLTKTESVDLTRKKDQISLEGNKSLSSARGNGSETMSSGGGSIREESESIFSEKNAVREKSEGLSLEKN